MVRDPVIVPYLADPVLDPYPAPRERSPDPPLPVASSSRYNEVEEADSLISILSVPPPAYSSHVEVAPPYPGPGPAEGEVEAIAIERETSPLEVAETLPLSVIPIPDRERSPPIGWTKVTIRQEDGAEMVFTLPRQSSIAELKTIWLAYAAIHDKAFGRILRITDFGLATNAVIEPESYTLAQLCVIHYRDEVLLEVVRYELVPAFLDDWPPDPGVGVTIKRFHRDQIEIIIVSSGHRMHVWPTSTFKDVKLCWARAAGIPASSITVLKGENVMDDNDTLKESLLHVMPMVTINEPQRPNGVLLLSIQVPRRFAHLYPRF